METSYDHYNQAQELRSLPISKKWLGVRVLSNLENRLNLSTTFRGTQHLGQEQKEF